MRLNLKLFFAFLNLLTQHVFLWENYWAEAFLKSAWDQFLIFPSEKVTLSTLYDVIILKYFLIAFDVSYERKGAFHNPWLFSKDQNGGFAEEERRCFEF